MHENVTDIPGCESAPEGRAIPKTRDLLVGVPWIDVRVICSHTDEHKGRARQPHKGTREAGLVPVMGRDKDVNTADK